MDTIEKGQDIMAYKILVDDHNIAETNETDISFRVADQESNMTNNLIQMNTVVTVRGLYIGRTYLHIVPNSNTSRAPCFQSDLTEIPKNSYSHLDSNDSVEIKVILRKSEYTNLFIILVTTLFFLHYINMGCAMDFGVIRGVLRKPIGPMVGIICQYICMPLVSCMFCR